MRFGAHHEEGTASLALPTAEQYPRVAQTPDDTGKMSIYGSSGVKQEQIELRPLDSLLASGAIEGRVSLLKLDVEGNEFNALRGAAAILQEHLPTVIAEINPPLLKLSGRSYEDIAGLLGELGYTPHVYRHGGLVAHEDGVEANTDIVFLPPRTSA
jgi:hypothetical protein